jgi:hypothetical protein
MDSQLFTKSASANQAAVAEECSRRFQGSVHEASVIWLEQPPPGHAQYPIKQIA